MKTTSSAVSDSDRYQLCCCSIHWWSAPRAKAKMTYHTPMMRLAGATRRSLERWEPGEPWAGGAVRTADARVGEAGDEGRLVAEQPAVARVVVELALADRDEPLAHPVGEGGLLHVEHRFSARKVFIKSAVLAENVVA